MYAIRLTWPVNHSPEKEGHESQAEEVAHYTLSD
jgi:hypothetical protein